MPEKFTFSIGCYDLKLTLPGRTAGFFNLQANVVRAGFLSAKVEVDSHS
jgi:hypothetical protein